MSDCGCNDTAATLSANTDHSRCHVLWVVLLINLALFVGEFSAGWWADSSALQADSLDSLGDALVYIVSLWVIGGTLRQRTKVVVLKAASRRYLAWPCWWRSFVVLGSAQSRSRR